MSGVVMGGVAVMEVLFWKTDCKWKADISGEANLMLWYVV